ncbi:MAG: chromosomal replication initiator protein DnaA [Deltaproteobacteria bacterium]|nr:chromosomal replication initiator protein DnaA [Deltaproteobacteria bacterium]
MNKYTFDRFVVGPSNQLAHAASLAVAEQPAEKYNPLFIYGGYGLGKTHLLHAIRLLTASVHPELNIQYISGEEFMDELIYAIRYDLMKKFREKYDNIDFLLFDGLHILAGKEKTKEEFFHVFNMLQDSEKQIVIASDKFPKDIAKLERRLRARYERGLIIDIQPPEIETRLAIVKNLIQESNIPMSNKISNYIARHVKSNVGELIGLLGLVNSYSSLTGRDINIDLVKEVLKIAKLGRASFN